MRVDSLDVPITYDIDHGQRIVRRICTDPVSGRDVLASQQRQADDGTWSYGSLVDTSATTRIPSSDEIRRFVDNIGRLALQRGARRGPIAIVVSLGTTTYGMARMYSVLAEQRNVTMEVFGTAEEAERWLQTSLSAMPRRDL